MVDENCKDVKAGEEGSLVIKNIWPGLAAGIYKDPQKFIDTYWKKYEKQGWYHPGDSAKIDEDGYLWVIGCSDDVIKVSGYRLGTAEVESALVSHPLVIEAAVIPLPHKLKGFGIHAFVILKNGATGSRELEMELKNHVAKVMGSIAKPEEILFIDSLPKTRSGKIMRRVLKARAQGLDEGDLSTLEE